MANIKRDMGIFKQIEAHTPEPSRQGLDDYVIETGCRFQERQKRAIPPVYS
jgi:hypothetical protein